MSTVLSMPPARRARQFALMLLAALCAEPALAVSETYAGQLKPIDGGPPIAIVVEMQELGTFLTGKVKTSSPLEGTAAIESGRNLGGQCSFSVTLKPAGSLRLAGTCDQAGFWGNFALRNAQGRVVSNGSFSLDRRKPEAEKGFGTPGTAALPTTVTACMAANARCLSACPRGNVDAEFLCANPCRSRLQACKAQAGKEAAAVE